MLDAGLGILSLAAGPVLGAFLVGVLSQAHRRTRHAGRDDHRHCRARLDLVVGRARLDVVRAGRRIGDQRRGAGRLLRARSQMTAFALADAVLRDAVAGRVFPAAAVEVGMRGAIAWRAAFGRLSYEDRAPEATIDTIFDLASLTKVIATATLAMRAVDEDLIRLDDPVAQWIPEWRGADRSSVTLRDLLEHSSGLTAYLPFFRDHTRAR